MTILILEDDEERGSDLKTASEAIGLKVIMTADVNQAIKIVTENKIQLASLDHDLGHPKLSGTDVALALTKIPASFPVMVHSSNYSAGRGMVEIMTNAGWDARFCGRNGGETQEAWLVTWVSAIRDALS